MEQSASATTEAHLPPCFCLCLGRAAMSILTTITHNIPWFLREPAEAIIGEVSAQSCASHRPLRSLKLAWPRPHPCPSRPPLLT